MTTDACRQTTTSTITQALHLVLVIAVVAVVTWAVRPDRLPLAADAEFYTLDLPAPLVSLDEARAAYDAGTHYFIDTRPDATLDDAIPGAFIVRAATFGDDMAAAMDFIYPEDPLILYGADRPVPVGDVAALFQRRGYENVRILQGGLAAWRDAGHPTTADAEVDDE